MKAPRIAVTTDFSDEAHEAFPWAASLARAFQAELFVVHQAQFPDLAQLLALEGEPLRMEENVESHIDRLEAALRRVVAEEPAFNALRTTCSIIRTAGADALRKFFDDEKISLVVCSSHGYTGYKRFFLGSFAAKLLRVAPCPVFVHRGKETAQATPDDFHPATILVPTDLTPPSEAAMRAGCHWAKKFGARVDLHYVVEPPSGLAGLSRSMLEGWFGFEKDERERATVALESAVTECGDDNVEYSLSTGRAVDEIKKRAAEIGADLIVVGTHAKTGLDHFMLGSVAEGTIAKASCPVLIVPPAASAGETMVDVASGAADGPSGGR